MTEAALPSGSDATRRRILEAAAVTLSTRGLAKTHLATIAGLARLRPPAVYHYFASREELIAAVMQEGQRMVRERVVASLDALPAGASPRERVDAAVAAHVVVELEESAFARAVVRNAGQLSHDARAAFEDESRAFHDVWRSLLGQAHAEEPLAGGMSPDVARLLVIGALNGCTAWWHEGIAVRDVVRTAQTLIGSALFGPPPRASAPGRAR